MCKIDIVISFLILIFIIIMVINKESNSLIIMLSSCWRCILLFFPLLHKLKENQSEKLSIILRLKDNSEWRSKKKEKIPLNLCQLSNSRILKFISIMIKFHNHLNEIIEEIRSELVIMIFFQVFVNKI